MNFYKKYIIGDLYVLFNLTAAILNGGSSIVSYLDDDYKLAITTSLLCGLSLGAFLFRILYLKSEEFNKALENTLKNQIKIIIAQQNTIEALEKKKAD